MKWILFTMMETITFSEKCSKAFFGRRCKYDFYPGVMAIKSQGNGTRTLFHSSETFVVDVSLFLNGTETFLTFPRVV